LLQLAASIMAESCRRAAKIMWLQPWSVQTHGSLLDDVPDCLSEMPWPQSLPARQTHRNNGPSRMSAAANHASSVSFTQFGTGTVRMCLPLPATTMAQRSSRRCKRSNVSSASSQRRSPQPSKIANIARLRFPVRVRQSGDCQKANASFAVNQLPKREPSLRTPLTRWMPAASSGLNRPESAAS
jgi:hypothetical protein